VTSTTTNTSDEKPKGKDKGRRDDDW
jgi:hypothetical protein